MQLFKRFIFTLIFVAATPCFKSFGQFYNGSYQDFGKNRVQYREFFWSYYKFNKFDIYFYTGGKELAIFTANVTNQVIEETEDFFDYVLEGSLQIIIYNKLSDLKQSNIGYTSDEDYNVGGVTRVVGSKIFLYFNGDHNHLIQQIREGVAEILISQMMYGGNWKDRVKNATLLALPDWYLEGLISYYTVGWNEETENRVKDGILSGRYKKFNHLSGVDAKYAGHSIWNFIVERYGESLIPSILYMTKVSRNIESGLLFVIGSSLKTLTNEWLEYYHNKFYGIERITSLPDNKMLLKKTKASKIYSQLKLSPNGKFAAYTSNQIGKYKVYLMDIQKDKKKRILKGGSKLDRFNDYSFPLLTWQPGSNILSIITEKKEEILLNYYFIDSKKKERRPLHNFQKILDFSYSNDGKKLVLSAVQNGQSDIFIYNLGKNTFENITNDIYDDFNPEFINNSSQIVFSSNRTNGTLPNAEPDSEPDLLIVLSKTYDLYLYDYQNKSTVLKRITNTPDINESNPIEFNDGYISYLAGINGVRNRYLASFDSVISHVDTIAHYRFTTKSWPVSNYSRSIIEQDASPLCHKYTEIVFADGRYQLYLDTISTVELLNNKQGILENQPKQDKINFGEESFKYDENKGMDKAPQNQVDTNRIDINNYVFEMEKTIRKNKPAAKPYNDSLVQKTNEMDSLYGKNAYFKYKRIIKNLLAPSKQWNYNTAFSTEYFVSQLDNRYLNQTYQKFTGGGAVYTNPGLNLFFKVGISDLFEDYRIVGGIRLSGNFNNSEYFISFENLKKRLDKQIVFHRQSLITFRANGTGIKVHTNDLKYTWKWPFNEAFSARGSAIIRNDRSVTLSTDVASLGVPNTYETWGGLKGEIVFDNTLKQGLNLYNGRRYKIFGEWYRQVDKENTNLYVVGIDYRNYLKIHRELIWANRLAASTSFGDKKLIYYLGGVDGWLKPEFDNSTNIANDQNYAYQSIATNMRGFKQNIRNGNSFALISSELRFPVFQYFMNRPMKSDFIKNFQIVGFGDAGTAWTGKSPYSSDNSFNTDRIKNGPITVRLIHQREPIVVGYGLGLRSRLWGYFIRIDWARGIEDGIVLPRVFYWSLSLDF